MRYQNTNKLITKIDKRLKNNVYLNINNKNE